MNAPTRLLPGNLLPARLLGGVASGTPAKPGTPLYCLGRPGRPAPLPTLLIADFDNSGSVTSPAGTDPLSNRFAEVAHAFSVVARKGSRRELGAVLHFDVPSSGEVAPVPLTRAGLRQLQAGLRVPPDGAATSRLGPSLEQARTLAAAYPDHAVTLVVLSDFLLLDADPPQVLATLGVFPGTVHAVVLGGRDVPDLPTGRVTVTKVQRTDPPGAVATAVFASLTRHRPGSRAFRESHAATADGSSHISQRPTSLLPLIRNVVP
ncbi:MAG: hypothetical protein ACRDRL_24935 [Sciscionella sp.]